MEIIRKTLDVKAVDMLRTEEGERECPKDKMNEFERERANKIIQFFYRVFKNSIFYDPQHSTILQYLQYISQCRLLPQTKSFEHYINIIGNLV
jgi:hypothetical protein